MQCSSIELSEVAEEDADWPSSAVALRLVRRVLGQHLRRRLAPVCHLHWSPSGMVLRPGRQRLVPRDGCHLDSSALRVSAHLLLGELRFCNELRLSF